MVYSAQQASKSCSQCGHLEEPGAKFCGSCGSCAWLSVPAMATVGSSIYAYAGHTPVEYPAQVAAVGTPTLVLPENMPKSTPPQLAKTLTQLSDINVPRFAHVRQIAPEVIQQNQIELAKLMVLLARERLFLLFHFAVFACVNIVGFVLALKCYNEFIGDEMSKIMVACTPFWVFNVVALTCLIPIKGTKRQIARLKEQIAHMRFKLDFGHLI